MLLTYVDESYTPAFYWIVALVCPEADIQPVTKGLDDVVEAAANGYRGISEKAELPATVSSMEPMTGRLSRRCLGRA